MMQLPRAQKAVHQHEPVDIESAVKCYQSPLLRYAARMLHGQHDLAQDLVQEAFVRLHKQIQGNGNKPLQDAKPWLYRVLHNLIIDNARLSKRSETVRRELAITPASGADPQSSDALDNMVQQEAADHALAVLNELPADQKQILLLKIIEGFTHRQIADIINKTPGHVGYQLTQGLKALTQKLKQRQII
jgi:RNA polymerase sigma-70 factor (ECF subfamily)